MDMNRFANVTKEFADCDLAKQNNLDHAEYYRQTDDYSTPFGVMAKVTNDSSGTPKLKNIQDFVNVPSIINYSKSNTLDLPLPNAAGEIVEKFPSSAPDPLLNKNTNCKTTNQKRKSTNSLMKFRRSNKLMIRLNPLQMEKLTNIAELGGKTPEEFLTAIIDSFSC